MKNFGLIKTKIEDKLVELEKCLENEKLPNSGEDCDNCRWFKEKLDKLT